jgi:hypothetical protein
MLIIICVLNYQRWHLHFKKIPPTSEIGRFNPICEIELDMISASQSGHVTDTDISP